MDLKKKFEQNYLQQNFPSKTETILVAVSGGKDSMALATLLYQFGFSIVLAHCNFKLRINDADLDEQLVTEWAAQNNIGLHRIAFDTEKVMKEQQKGVQETARMLRYDWFKNLCKENHYAAIATAHHANDNVETLLMNLCKGTGIAGLHGIPAKNENIIRPLLFATRTEIDDYVAQENIPFRDDSSNASTKYLRNAVRHTIIPALNELFPNVINRLSENIERFKQVEEIYRSAMELKKKKLIEQRGKDFYIPILKLQKESALETVCFELFSDFGFTAHQTQEIVKLLKSESGHFVASESHKVIRNRMFLIVTEQKTEHTDIILVSNLEDDVQTENGSFSFRVKANAAAPDSSANMATIDFDAIRLPLTLRRWRTGDYFYPFGMGMKKKKVGRFLIDQKVPVHQKEKIWILESNQKIIWVAGMRIDERFKIKERTKNVVEIRFSGT